MQTYPTGTNPARETPAEPHSIPLRSILARFIDFESAGDPHRWNGASLENNWSPGRQPSDARQIATIVTAWGSRFTGQRPGAFVNEGAFGPKRPSRDIKDICTGLQHIR